MRIKCPKCGSKLPKWNGVTKSVECITCGKEIRGTMAMHALIQSNKREIAHDYVTIGLRETLAKWGISTDALYHLEEVQALRHKYSRIITSKGGIPGIPEFKEEWADDVKVMWLEVYQIAQLPPFNEKWAAETKTQWLKTFDNILANVSSDFVCGR